jgi:hypothetical protein
MTPAAVNVAATSTTLLAENKSAKYRLIQNDDESTDMWIKPAAAAVAHQGMRLAPGQAYEMAREFGNMDVRAWYGIHAGTGNKVALVSEGV